MPVESMSRIRRGVASLVGAAVALAPGVLGACYTVFGPGFVNPDGTPDNPPMRAAGVFLLASPLLFGILAAFYGVAIQALFRAGRLSATPLSLVSIAAGVAFWIWMLVRAGSVSSGDAVGIAVLSGIVALLLTGGSLASWLVVRAGHNKPLHPPAGLNVLSEGDAALPRRG